MKKTLCYSVRLDSLTSISDKCFKAKSFDGKEDLIPKSQVFGRDYDVTKSDAYWISAWLLEKKGIQYSEKKKAWYNPVTDSMNPHVTIITEKHVPIKIEPLNTTPDADLIR